MVEFTVAFRAEPCVAAINEPGVAKFPEDRPFQWLEGLLLVLIPGEDGEGQGYPVPVREHPHLYDRVRAVFLALSVLFDPIFLLDLKIVIRAVVIEDAVIPVYQKIAVLEGL